MDGLRDYAIFLIGPEGTIVTWNAGAEALFGYSAEEAVGEPLEMLYPPDVREDGLPERLLELARKEERAFGLRLKIRKDGSVFWTAGTIAAVRDEAGELEGFVKLVRDATERYERREELHRARVTMEERAGEQEEELARVRRDASEVIVSEKALRRAVARRLHDDLQQRIYALQMSVSMARKAFEGGEQEEVVQQLGELEDAAREAMATTRTLTDDLSSPALEASDLGRTVERLRRKMADRYQLEVRLERVRDFDVVDEELLLAVVESLRELLFNVVKHAGVDRVTVRLTRRSGRRAIQVVDGGRGFDVGTMRRDGPSGARGSVTGFGLSNVSERLRRHGAELEIESAPEEGTRATILLPEEPEGEG